MIKARRLMNASLVSIIEDASRERERRKRQRKMNRLAKVIKAARAIFV